MKRRNLKNEKSIKLYFLNERFEKILIEYRIIEMKFNR